MRKTKKSSGFGDNLKWNYPPFRYVRGQLKNDSYKRSDTAVGILIAMTGHGPAGTSRRRYVSSSVRGNSTHTITIPTWEARTPLTYPETSHLRTRGAPLVGRIWR
ncbi:hypothetical protein AVEN_241988-1 [Araneus ventricosus]|uniref:Uncharacterized protein n=1 Tax=Araneus ventricosus TaxID=182803 RepID=A0A4Y2EBN1_ARAVE|nr:hypothetical protein AVEN_241988-1 [Araneus ventricosus]